MKKFIYKFISNFSEKLRSDKLSTSNKILLFHSIETKKDKKDLYTLDKYVFEKMIIFLKEMKFNFVSFNEVYNNQNNIIISFDDGFMSVLNNALPILEKYDIPFHVFINKNFIQSNNKLFLNKKGLIELSNKKNVELGSHGVSHMKLSQLTTQQIKEEISESKIWLEDITGKIVNTFSYPHGSFDNRAKKYLEEFGYNFAASSKFGDVNNLTPKFELPRLDIWSTDTNKILYQKINGHWNWLNYVQNLKK
mgnify:CR=1 FL=1|jgi:peptidoglycan/xylan/chitin deacetylase (PgdA/CDA1 family)